MLKYYVMKAVKRLGTDQDGVVSFEYVIVAACIIAVVAAGFGTGGPLRTALTGGITAITTAMAGLLTSRGGIGMSQCPTFFEACI